MIINGARECVRISLTSSLVYSDKVSNVIRDAAELVYS